MFKNIIIFLVVFVGLSLESKVVDIVYEGISDKKIRSNARKEIFKKSIDETSKEYIKQIIGEVKFNRNLGLIENKIIKNSGKYIPYTRGSKLEYDRDKKENHMSVSLKISLDNLKRLLLKSGLLYKSDNTPKILPLIKITDHVKFKKNTWWTLNSKQKNYYDDLVKLIHENIEEIFVEKNFHTLSPVKSKGYVRIPQILKNGNLRKEEGLLLGEYFNSEIIIDGEVSIQKNSSISDNYKITYRLVAKQVNNGRVIGEVKRFYLTNAGEMKSVVYENLVKTSKKVILDLSEQIEDSWQKGIFGSNSLLLIVQGKLNYFQMKSFKDQLNLLSSIRLLRDRFYSNGLVKFEADVSIGVRRLSDIIGKTKFKNLKVSVDEVDKNKLVLSVRTI